MSMPSFEASAEDLRRLLPDLAERTASQLLELHRAPTVERAERISIELEGLRMTALRMRAALISEGEGHGQ